MYVLLYNYFGIFVWMNLSSQFIIMLSFQSI